MYLYMSMFIAYMCSPDSINIWHIWWYRNVKEQIVRVSSGFVRPTTFCSNDKRGWGLMAFLRWWPPSTMHAGGSFNIYAHHRWCLNNPIFSNLGSCAACWAHFMCHHELWPFVCDQGRRAFFEIFRSINPIPPKVMFKLFNTHIALRQWCLGLQQEWNIDCWWSHVAFL